MHTKTAREAEETGERITAISVWRDSPLFSDEEKVIPAMTEEVTLVPKEIDPGVVERARKLPDEHEIAEVVLTSAL